MRRTIFYRVLCWAGFIIAALATAPTVLAASDYYKWTDDQGVTHYSARKPHDRQAEVVNIATGEPEPRTSTSQDQRESGATTETDSESRNTAESENQSAAAKDPERCKVARDNLETLRNNARIRMRDDSGEIYYLSEEEKAEKTREFEQAVKESC